MWINDETVKVESAMPQPGDRPMTTAEIEAFYLQNEKQTRYGELKNEIAKFLAINSADKQNNRRSNRINQSIPADATPIRISETRYFTSKHDEVSANTFKRKSIGSPSNCIACHKGAEKGDFSESQVRVPR